MTKESPHRGWVVAAIGRPVEVLDILRRDGLVIAAADDAAVADLRGTAHTASDSRDTDDLQPARAIRRALAGGALNAREVGFVAVYAVGPRARGRAEHAVTRGFGRFAAGMAVSFDDSEVAALCVAAIERGEVSAAVALTIDPIAGNLALAFGRPR